MRLPSSARRQCKVVGSQGDNTPVGVKIGEALFNTSATNSPGLTDQPGTPRRSWVLKLMRSFEDDLTRSDGTVFLQCEQ